MNRPLLRGEAPIPAPLPPAQPSTASERIGLLKHAWRNWGIRRWVLERRFDALERQWQAAQAQVQPARGIASNILIIPSDPELLTNSTGDQAMIGAIVAYWRSIYPHACFHVAVAERAAEVAAGETGMIPLFLLAHDSTFQSAMEQVEACRIGTVVAMGADVLDGSYNVAFSGRQLMLLDLLARGGAHSYITGFSVSEHLHPRIARLFDALAPSIRINLRDPVSFDRFRTHCAPPASLVADVAFLLLPRATALTDAITGWIEARRQAGYTVLGLNCHPLLLELEQRQEMDRFIDCFVDALAGFAAQRKVAFLLIDHDCRGSSADAICLRPLHERLAARIGADRIEYPAARLAADEIKTVVGALDGVVSGRMHLMIAAMGAGTPVFGVDYKDKMEGLLTHFDLPTDMLCTAGEVMQPGNGVARRLARFADQIDGIRQQVVATKPRVQAAAMHNFARTPG